MSENIFGRQSFNSNRVVWITACLLALGVAGCSAFKAKDDNGGYYAEGEATDSMSATTNAEALPEEMTELEPMATKEASAPTPIIDCHPDLKDQVKANHPSHYVIVKGDTLWDIAGKFLRDPWFWPEIWHINQYIKNPHLIFPGDQLDLIYVNGCPQIAVTRGATATGITEDLSSGTANGREKLSPQIRSYALDQAITTIPYEAISSFINRPAMLSKEEVKDAPYVAAIRDNHLIGGSSNDLYVRGDTLENFPVGTRMNVFHVGDKLVDPDSGRTLGYQALFVGTGVLHREGDPATLYMLDTTREALRGDRLLPEQTNIPLNFFPRAPESEVKGTVMSSIDGMAIVGQYQVLSINLGQRQGIEPGHVLSVWQRGDKVSDLYSGGRLTPSTRGGGSLRLPEEQIGIVLVFRSYERMSFALVMSATNEITVGDSLKSPKRR